MIIGGKLFLHGNNFSNFSPRFPCLQPRFSFVRRFVPGRFTAWPGLILLQFFHCGNSQGVLPNFQYCLSVLIFRVQKFTLNQYLGSLYNNMDQISIFGVHKSVEKKDHGICLPWTSHGMQCDPEVANHGINVSVLFKNLERSRSSN